jgi:ketosteroid isomerase-like protein
MKKLAALVLFACAVAALVFAHSSKAPSAGLSDADTLRKMSRDWADATKAIDVNRLGQIIADDWKYVGAYGKIKSKEDALNYVQTRDIKLQSYKFGPMDVKMMGNVGVVQGSITQHFINAKDGRHENYSSVWMDVLEKRGDKWVVVRSKGNNIPKD